MSSLSCNCCHYYTTRASLVDNIPPPPSSSSSSSSPQTNNHLNKPEIPSTKPTKQVPSGKNPRHPMHLPMQKHKSQNQFQRQLSIMQIERAISAGSFRDAEPRDLQKEKIEYDGILPNLSRMFETPIQKRIRETGEWVAANTEARLQSSRKGILLFMFTWILPIWTLSLLVASGAIKLPFNIPFLDDLIA